jgi:hypothetical protein
VEQTKSDGNLWNYHAARIKAVTQIVKKADMPTDK